MRRQYPYTKNVKGVQIMSKSKKIMVTEAKAPAALYRKIAIAKLTGNHEIEILGDGKQTRSFCYIDDCAGGLYIMKD